MQHLQRGFTLIELMVVLLIIGVLSALIVPNVLDRLDEGKVTGAKSDINTLVQSLKMYKLDNQRFPTAEQGLQALTAKPTASPVPRSPSASRPRPGPTSCAATSTGCARGARGGRWASSPARWARSRSTRPSSTRSPCAGTSAPSSDWATRVRPG